MKPGPLFRSRVFRLILLGTFFFSLTSIAFVAVLYLEGEKALSRQLDVAIDADAGALAVLNKLQGTDAVRKALKARTENPAWSSALYFLARTDGTKLAGNLDRWPPGALDGRKWVEFELARRVGTEAIRSTGRAQIVVLSKNVRLLAGQDMSGHLGTVSELRDTLIWGGAIVLIAFFILGALISWRIVRRVEAINGISSDIVGGSVTLRLPVSGSGDEFDRLSATLNEMVERIQALTRRVNEIAENIAHDLRSPLGRLRARLEGTSSTQMTDEERHAAIIDAIDQTDSVLRTFSSIFQIAQIESGTLRKNFEPVNVGEMMRDVAEFYEPMVEEAGLHFDPRIPRGEVLVLGDRSLLFQVCVNLIENAIKYAGAGCRVVFELTQDKERNAAWIEVEDDGPGMSGAALNRARDRFYRVDASRSTAGAGLGLSLVDAVTELHGGAFMLTNAYPNADEEAGETKGLLASISIPLMSPVSEGQIQQDMESGKLEWSPSTD